MGILVKNELLSAVIVDIKESFQMPDCMFIFGHITFRLETILKFRLGGV